MEDLFAIIDRLARPHRGRVTRCALLTAGVPSSTISRMLTVGLLLTEGAHTYRIAGSPDDPIAQAHGVLLSVGPDAALGRRSAAALHGLLPLQLRAPFDVTHVNARAPARTRFGVDTFRSLRFRPVEDVIIISGLRVTRIERTVFELVARGLVVDVDELVSVAIVFCGATPASLMEQYELVGNLAHKGRVKAAVLRLAPDVGKARATGEVTVPSICRDFGLPAPVLAHRVEGPNHPFEADCAYLALRIWIEVDSKLWHRGLTVTTSDADRQNWLVNDGWHVLRFPGQLLRDDPAAVARAICAALRARGYPGTLPNL